MHNVQVSRKHHCFIYVVTVVFIYVCFVVCKKEIK